MFKATIAFVALALILHRVAPASDYPQVSETTHWGIGSFGLSSGTVHLSAIDKTVYTSPSNFVNKTVFYSLSVPGVRIGSNTYTFSGHSGEYASTTSEYSLRYGYYNVAGTAYQLLINFYFYKDGRFRILSVWSQGNPGTDTDVYVRFDYDLDGSSDDIVEYVKTENSIEQWYGPSNESSVSFASMTTEKTNTLENNAFCRFVDATSPTTQFYVVLWPDYQTPIQLYMKNYSYDYGTLPPTVNTSTALQSTDDHISFQQYAYSGNDQIAWAALKYHSAYGNYSIQGKVFQKPNARPVKVNLHVMSGAYNPSPDTTVTVDNSRSLRDALNDLTNSTWSMTAKTGLTNPYGTTMTYAQCHNFMLNARSASPSIYTSATRQNFRDWHSDIAIVDCQAPADGTIGALFDQGTNDSNFTSREGAMVFWNEIEEWYSGTTVQKKIARWTLAHELGHTFNFSHTWGSCGTNYHPPGAGGSCSNGSIMTYSFMDYSGSSKPYTHTGATTMTYFTNHVDLFQKGPESWVKPGRFGTLWHGLSSSSPPSYSNY